MEPTRYHTFVKTPVSAPNLAAQTNGLLGIAKPRECSRTPLTLYIIKTSQQFRWSRLNSTESLPTDRLQCDSTAAHNGGCHGTTFAAKAVCCSV